MSINLDALPEYVNYTCYGSVTSPAVFELLARPVNAEDVGIVGFELGYLPEEAMSPVEAGIMKGVRRYVARRTEVPGSVVQGLLLQGIHRDEELPYLLDFDNSDPIEIGGLGRYEVTQIQVRRPYTDQVVNSLFVPRKVVQGETIELANPLNYDPYRPFAVGPFNDTLTGRARVLNSARESRQLTYNFLHPKQ